MLREDEPFYRLFQELKQHGVKLDLKQYSDFLLAWMNGYDRDLIQHIDKKWGIDDDFESIKWLMKALWISEPKYIPIFEQLFSHFREGLEQPINRIKKELTVNTDRHKKETKGEDKQKENNNTWDQTGIGDQIVISKKRDEKTQDDLDSQNMLKKETTKPPVIDEFKNEFEEITLNFEQDKNKVRTGFQEPTYAKDQKIAHDFIFSEKYFPLSKMQLFRTWKHLKHRAIKVESRFIDIDRIIRDKVQNRFYHRLYLKTTKIFDSPTFFLIDQGGSMVAFERYAEIIQQTFQASLRPIQDSFHTYYFHDIPLSLDYKSDKGWAFFEMDEFLKKINKKTIIVIISDAGAARGKLDMDRAQDTKLFLDGVKKKTNGVFWLNPVQEDRWGYSSALYISTMLPMLELNENGMGKLSQHLKSI